MNEIYTDYARNNKGIINQPIICLNCNNYIIYSDKDIHIANNELFVICPNCKKPIIFGSLNKDYEPKQLNKKETIKVIKTLLRFKKQ